MRRTPPSRPRPYHTLVRGAALALALAVLPGAGAVSGQSPVTTTVGLNFLSNYFFAGIPFSTGEVTQASASVATGGFTFNAFGVYDHDASDLTELDVYGDYYTQLSPALGLFVGAALYHFKYPDPLGWEGTPEVYGGLVLTAPLSPTLYVAHDFDLGDGTHATLMLSHSVPLGASGATLDLAGNIDYNDDYYVDFSGISYGDVGASVGIPVGPLTISPSVALQFALDEEFQQQAFIDDVEEIFGIAASATF